MRMSKYERQPKYTGAERLRKSPYKEYQPGDTLAFTHNTLNPDGTITTSNKEITIKEVRGGGFFGKVLIPEGEDFVIKTSLPDPWHHLWRVINWDFSDLPARTSEKQAQLEQLSTNLIADVLPVLTDGRYRSPRCLGYTQLATGYALAIEKMQGRGPRFDKDDESRRFEYAQEELTPLAFDLGLEPVAAIHTDNLFARANIWYDPDTRTFIWLDPNSAIPHKGFIWPGFYFRFHDEIRRKFHGRKFKEHPPTFNEIHTDYFFATLYNNRHKFPPQVFEQIKANLRLYRDLWKETEQEKTQQQNKKAVLEALSEFAKDALTDRFVYKLLADTSFRKEKLETLAQLIKDPEYRTRYYNENFALRGVESARKDGLITYEEWKEAWDAVKDYESDPKRKWILPILQGYYFGVNRFIDLTTGSTLVTSFLSENPFINLVWSAAIFTIGPPLLRVSGTLATQEATKIDLRVAAAVTAIPLVPIIPSYGALPAQITATEGGNSKKIWHHTVLWFVTKISNIHPAGGPGSKVQGVIWEKAGRHIEKLGSPKD